MANKMIYFDPAQGSTKLLVSGVGCSSIKFFTKSLIFEFLAMQRKIYTKIAAQYDHKKSVTTIEDAIFGEGTV